MVSLTDGSSLSTNGRQECGASKCPSKLMVQDRKRHTIKVLPAERESLCESRDLKCAGTGVRSEQKRETFVWFYTGISGE